MTDVVFQIRPSVRQSYIGRREDIPVSLTALYDKLQRIEVSTSEALVRHSFAQLQLVVDTMKARRSPWVPGYEVKVIDGNCVASTEHRLAVLRDTHAGALPGKGLVIYHAGLDLIEDCVLCEDGHAQERSLFDNWLAKGKEGEVWIADRNFCTAGALFGLHDRAARFAIREHATNAPWEEAGPRQERGRVETGRVYEQSVRLLGPDDRKRLVRRVTLVLDMPTRDGEKEIHVLTNLTRKELTAQGVADLYRKRWTIEGAFLHLAEDLRSEVTTLGYPPAALFGFSVGRMAYNLLSTMKAAIRAEHSDEVAASMSGYAMAEEVAGTYRGMMVALPPATWEELPTWSPKQVGSYLRHLAAHVDLARFQKTVRGPKKPRTPRTASTNAPHVSTAQLLLSRRGPK